MFNIQSIVLILRKFQTMMYAEMKCEVLTKEILS